MLINEYRLEIQFKKVRKVRNINNIPMVGNGRVPTIGMYSRPAQNERVERTLHVFKLNNVQGHGKVVHFYLRKYSLT